VTKDFLDTFAILAQYRIVMDERLYID